MPELTTITAAELATAGGPRHLMGGPPVRLSGWLAETPLMQMTPGAIAELLADEPVKLVETYEQFLGPTVDEPRTYSTTYGRFLELAEGTDDLPLYVSENPTPPRVRELLPWPSPLDGPFERLRTHTFVGAGGNCAPFHVDGDTRHVLLHQVFGSKRVYLLPGTAGRHLDPVFNFGGVPFHDLPHEERVRFIDAAGGWWGVIGPGESMYMGPGVWHCIEYLDFTMSVNVRFGRHLENFLLSRLPAVHELGALAYDRSTRPPDDDDLAWVLSMLDTYYAPYDTASDRLRAMREAYHRRLACRGLLHTVRAPYPSIDREALALDGTLDLLAARLPGHDHRLWIGDVEVTGDGRLDDAQRAELDATLADFPPGRAEAWMRLLGLPSDVSSWSGYHAAMFVDFAAYGIQTRDAGTRPTEVDRASSAA